MLLQPEISKLYFSRKIELFRQSNNQLIKDSIDVDDMARSISFRYYT